MSRYRVEAQTDGVALAAVAVYDDDRLIGRARGSVYQKCLKTWSDVELDPDVADSAGAALVGFVRTARIARWELDDLPPGAVALSLPSLPGDHDEVEIVSRSPLRLRRTLEFGECETDPRLVEAMEQVRAILRGCAPDRIGVRAMLADADHRTVSATPEAGVHRWAQFFDQAARRSPESSVALYSLGDPGLLRAATAEVADRLRDWGLIGPDRRVLDLGCGIGRIEEALAGEVASIVGLDVSGEMLAHARRRCAGQSTVRFVEGSGLDLAPILDASFDLVLAVDSVPYLVLTGVVQKHFAEARRVLRPGGDLVILQFSYRGDPAADRAEVARLAEAHGFVVLRDGVRAFGAWDGLAFHLRRD